MFFQCLHFKDKKLSFVFLRENPSVRVQQSEASSKNKSNPMMMAENALAHAGKCIDIPNPRFEELSDKNGKGLIIADPVYSTDRNFTGKPIPGYDSPKIILDRQVIENLKVATASLRKGLERKGIPAAEAAKFVLIVKDGYRPHESATHAMGEFGKAHGISKAYLSYSVSGHNSGKTVDLTLGYKDDGEIKEVWMGARYDEALYIFVDKSLKTKGYKPEHSNLDNAGRPTPLPEDSRYSYNQAGYKVVDGVATLELRNILSTAMQTSGAKPMNSEYWHFKYEGGGCYNQPIG